MPGLYDKYGRDDGAFIREVFGELDVQYSGDDRKWAFDITPGRLKDRCRVLVPDGKKALALGARYGRGTVLITALPFRQKQHSQLLVPHFYATVDNALGAQFVKCMYDRFEVVARAKGKRRFLAVCNYSLTNTLKDMLTIKGQYRKVIDHGIGPKFAFLPLPPKHGEPSLESPVDAGVFYMPGHSPPGFTSFWLKLRPGEATILELVR